MSNVIPLADPTATPSDEIPIDFDAFYLIYPRHEAKKDALKAWGQINPALHNKIVVAAAAWRKVWLKRGELQYVPLPATWLRGERWEDELPTDASAPISSAHVAFGPSAPLPAKTDIPEHVRALLRKLTGRA